MGSGLVSLFWLVFGTANSPTLAVVFIASVVVFCWGAYDAWANTDRLLLDEKAKNGKPEIKCTINAGYITQVLNTYQQDGKTTVIEDSVVVLEVVLENLRGVPTTILGKELIFTDSNTGEKYAGRWVEFMYACSVLQEPVPGQMGVYFEYPIEILITTERPLEYAKPKKCWIRFFMENVPARDYSGVRVELRLQDGTGQWWTFKTLMPLKFGKMREDKGKLANTLKP